MKPSKRRRDAVTEHIKEIQATLLLTNWTVSVEYPTESDEEGAVARINTNNNYSEAAIELYPEFWELSQIDRYFTLVHEMTHILTARIHEHCLHLYAGVLVTRREIDATLELLTQHVARVITSLKGGEK